MLSQTVEYALRAAVAIADRYDVPCTNQKIAEATSVPTAYLPKVMRSLVRAGLVGSQRGIHGGFRLRHDPADITILDVVNAVEPIQRIRECPLSIGSHGINLCALHRRLDDALGMVESAFRDTTLSELLTDSPTIRPLCDVVPSVNVKSH